MRDRADGRDVGTVWLEQEVGLFSARLGILLGDERLFGCGIGAQVVRLVVERARAGELQVHTLALRVRRSNVCALACFENCGFVAVGSGRKLRSDGTVIEFLRMERRRVALSARGIRGYSLADHQPPDQHIRWPAAPRYTDAVLRRRRSRHGRAKRQAWLSPSAGRDVATVAEVIAARRSVRSFADAMPPREALEEILAAGLAAPYAAAMAPGTALDRRFFVLPRRSDALQAAATVIKAHALEALGEGEPPAPLGARLGPIAQGRIPGVGSAPYYVVVAERGAMMAATQQSIAHASRTCG